jgi:hypothetical protein
LKENYVGMIKAFFLESEDRNRNLLNVEKMKVKKMMMLIKKKKKRK